VVVHQTGASAASDPAAVDSGTILAARLAEALVKDSKRNVPIIVDLMLDSNAAFITENLSKMKERDPLEKEQALEEEDLIRLEEANDWPLVMQQRFVVGQMFSSVLVTCLLANMLYNRGLAAIFREMMRSAYTIVPMPAGSRCNTFGELAKFMVRKRNLLAMGLVRRVDVQIWDDEELEDEIAKQAEFVKSIGAQVKPGADPSQPNAAAAMGPPVSVDNPFAALAAAAVGRAEALDPTHLAEFRERFTKLNDGKFVPAKKWRPEDGCKDRYVYTMPAGDNFIDGTDGILCLMPCLGTADGISRTTGAV
jgi:hypothetical protein